MKKNAIRMDDWSVMLKPDFDPYLAPELIPVCLHGSVIGHPGLGDGFLLTSPIISVRGRYVTTQSGTLYYLGRISKSYRKYLRKTRPEWNWREPITVRPSKSTRKSNSKIYSKAPNSPVETL